MKTCTKCQIEKPLTAFYIERRVKDGCTAECRACLTAAANAQHRAKPEKTKANNQRWYANNLAWSTAKTQWRRAQKRHVTPAWANQFFISEIYDLAQRRTKATGIEWHVDHIVPLRSNIVSGLHVEQNLRVIPKSTNLAKGNRHWPDMPGAL